MNVVSAVRYAVRAMAGSVLLAASFTMTSHPAMAGEGAGCLNNFRPFACWGFEAGQFAEFTEEQACVENGAVVPESGLCLTCVEEEDEVCTWGLVAHTDYEEWESGGEN